ncbi:glycosyltransferase family 9 protein [Escherichia coli]
MPALTDAEQAIPGISLTGWWKKGCTDPSWHAAVERVIPWQYVARVKPGSRPIKAGRKAFREALQAENYDAVIEAQGLVKSAALVTRLAHGVKHGWTGKPLANR